MDINMIKVDVNRNGRRSHDGRSVTNSEFLSQQLGEVEFSSSSRTSKYVIVPHNTDPDTLLDLLIEEWDLCLPKLLISVTGGAKSYSRDWDPRLEDVVGSGLMKCASSTGGWLVSGGTHTGVMKMVGEAVKEHDVKNMVVALGIAPYAMIYNQERLKSAQSGRSKRVSYLVRPSEIKETDCSLDPNHSHFVLVEGPNNTWGDEIEFRAKLEREISHRAPDNYPIPAVCVCIEGGKGSLNAVNEALQKGIPAVIVQGSGGVADLLAYAYNNTLEMLDNQGKVDMQRVVSCVVEDLWTSVEAKAMLVAERELDNSEDKQEGQNVRTLIELVKSCIKKRPLMTVYKLGSKNSPKDIDVAILQALLKVQKGSVKLQMRLALEWNRVDIAKTYILHTRSMEKNLSATQREDDLKELLTTAMLKDNREFTKLFLENGLDNEEFVNRDYLIELYLDTKYSRTPFGQLLQKQIQPNNKPEAVMQKIKDLMRSLSSGLYTINFKCTTPMERRRELFFWSVVTARKNIALLLWKSLKDGMATMLIAQKLTKSLQEKMEDARMEKLMQQHRSYYGSMAVEALQESYSTDAEKTDALLGRRVPAYSRCDALQIAVEANNQNFIAHVACQNHLTDVWSASIDPANSNAKIWCCCVLPVFIPFLVDFRSVQDIKSDRQKYKDREDDTACDGCKSLFAKFYYFFTSPRVIYIYNFISYLILLVLYSGMLMTHFHKSVSTLEWCLIVWVGTLLLEEIRQIICNGGAGLRGKLTAHFGNIWNIIDLISIAVFATGTAVRLACASSDCMEAARVVLAVALIAFFIRLLSFFSISKYLGPKVVMIGNMLRDLVFFMLMLLIFIISFGIATQAILYPNSDLDEKLIENIFRLPYWQIYGELFLDEIEGTRDCSNDPAVYKSGDLPRCADNKKMVPILLGGYILITNVLLLNLLIAMFSYTFQKVHQNTDAVWKTQRYHYVMDYRNRSWLVPPFILLSHVYQVLKGNIQALRKCCTKKQQNYDDLYNDILEWERRNVNEVVHQEMKMMADGSSASKKFHLQNIGHSLSFISDGVDNLTHELNEASDLSSAEPTLAERMIYLENQMSNTAQIIAHIAHTLGHSVSGTPTSKNQVPMRTLDTPTQIHARQQELIRSEQAINSSGSTQHLMFTRVSEISTI